MVSVHLSQMDSGASIPLARAWEAVLSLAVAAGLGLASAWGAPAGGQAAGWEKDGKAVVEFLLPAG